MSLFVLLEIFAGSLLRTFRTCSRCVSEMLCPVLSSGPASLLHWLPVLMSCYSEMQSRTESDDVVRAPRPAPPASAGQHPPSEHAAGQQPALDSAPAQTAQPAARSQAQSQVHSPQSPPPHLISQRLHFVAVPLPATTPHIHFPAGAECANVEGSAFSYVNFVDYSPAGAATRRLAIGTQISFLSRARAHETKTGRVGRIGIKPRPKHGLEMELIVVADGKAREVKPSNLRLSDDDKRAPALDSAAVKAVTDKADEWIEQHHVRAAEAKRKRATIEAMDIASRLRSARTRDDREESATSADEGERESKRKISRKTSKVKRQKADDAQARNKRKSKGKSRRSSASSAWPSRSPSPSERRPKLEERSGDRRSSRSPRSHGAEHRRRARSQSPRQPPPQHSCTNAPPFPFAWPYGPFVPLAPYQMPSPYAAPYPPPPPPPSLYGSYPAPTAFGAPAHYAAPQACSDPAHVRELQKMACEHGMALQSSHAFARLI